MNPISSVYIHIPFCHHLCGYCDFVHVIYQEKKADLVLKQLQIDAFKLTKSSCKTIYIGGGTPSALSLTQLDQIKSILDYLKADQCEITMELNPESVDVAKAEKLAEIGVNRVSIGVQATSDALLKVLTRQHNFDKALQAIKFCQAVGINNISVDVMYGIPTQTIADFDDTLQKLIAVKIPHVSLYALTIHPNTPFYKQNIQPAPIDLEASFYEHAIKTLTNSSYEHYEVSNFACANHQSLHNLGYWHYQDFIGLGPGAASKIGHIRTINTSSIDHYINQTELIEEEIINSKKESMFEWVMMNSRLSSGMRFDLFEQAFQQSFLSTYKDALQQATKRGWLSVESDRCKTTDQGRLLLHDMLLLFMDD